MPVSALTSTNTCWLFISDSNEPRHLNDIIYAAAMLKSRGVATGDIYVFTDHPLAATHLAPFGLTTIHPVAAFTTIPATLSRYNAAVTVVTGHGHPLGIGSPGVILSPSALFAAVRSIPRIAVGVVVLGQCFAGIFNFPEATQPPPLVVLGATNLNMSLSADITLVHPVVDLSGAPALSGWAANIFLIHLFRWIAQPVDVDGDGALTLMDAYKFAGTQSNQHLVGLKSGLFVEVDKESAHVQRLEAATNPPTPQLVIDAARQTLQRHLETLHLHQEPWVLNAHQARDVRFW